MSKYSVGKQFETNRSGPIEIIEVLPEYKVRVKFLNTGHELVARISNIPSGRIKDPTCAYYKDGNYKIKIGCVYPTNYYGNVEVIGRIDTLTVIVRFLDTGAEREVRTSSLISGKVRDHSAGPMRNKGRNYGLKLDPGTVFRNSQGHSFEIIEFNNAKNVVIRFTNTGTTRTTYTSAVLTGRILDYMEPSVAGIGYLGTEDYANVCPHIKNLWRGVVSRAADETLRSTVCERWLSMKQFAEDVPFIPGYAKWLESKVSITEENYHLDKDFLFTGNSEYAPGKVLFISETDNTTEAMLRKYAKLHEGTEIGDHMNKAYDLLRAKVLTIR